MKPVEVIDLATAEVALGADDDVLVALASLLRDETVRVPEVLKLLDDLERIKDPRESVRKWLYLILKGVYCERQRLRDPLGIVEGIYADFDYPPSVAPFVRYMPLRPGDQPGPDPLIERWREYLAAERKQLRRTI